MTELEKAYERLNELEDLLGDAWSVLEGDAGYAKAGVIEHIKAYFEQRKNER